MRGLGTLVRVSGNFQAELQEYNGIGHLERKYDHFQKSTPFLKGLLVSALPPEASGRRTQLHYCQLKQECRLFYSTILQSTQKLPRLLEKQSMYSYDNLIGLNSTKLGVRKVRVHHCFRYRKFLTSRRDLLRLAPSTNQCNNTDTIAGFVGTRIDVDGAAASVY
jgi:hypothetical protein